MGRAGSGSGGSGGSFGGHSPSSRSSGGHHVGSSTGRAGMGSRPSPSSRSYGSGPSRNYGPSHYGPPPPPPPRHYSSYHRYDYGYPPPVVHHYYGRRSTLATIIVVIIIAIAVFASSMSGAVSSIPASTQNRTKLSTGIAYQNDCIQDEIGWIENKASLSKDLQKFYNTTGVQPYIYLRAYDANLQTDADKTAFAEQWYEENIGNEGTFLFMYFAEQDVDNDVGYMAYVNGKQVTSVMDAEAVEIFWAYVDSYWYSDMSTVDMFDSIFNDTAERIMTVTTTKADVGKAAFRAAAVIAVGVIIVVVLVIHNKRKKEENEETAKILGTPLDSSDSLVDKYTE